MAQEVYVYPRKVVDFDDIVGQVSVAASAVGTKIVWSKGNSSSLYTRTGRRGRLVHIGNSVDPGGESKVTFHLKINNSRSAVPPYDSFQQAMGLTYDGQNRIAVPIDLPQGALVEVEADNSDSANAYYGYIRLRIEYEDFPE